LNGGDIKERLKTLSPQQKRLLMQAVSARQKRQERIPRYPATDVVPQSYSQRRLWYLYKLDPGTSMYNMPQAAMFRGPLSIADMEAAFNDVIGRHKILRAVFADRSSGPVQEIHPARHHEIERMDLSDLPRDRAEAEAIALSHKLSDRPFDLVNGPVVTMSIIKVAADEHLLLINMHHIVSDGWSVTVFVQDCLELYCARLENRLPTLPELSIDFVDYIQWQLERLSGEALERQLAYWKGRLAGVQPLALPFDRAPSVHTSARGGYELITLSPQQRDTLFAVAKQSGSTLFMALLAAFKVLLFRYSDQTDINVGVPVAGRNRVETENLIGFFANTALIRTDLSGDPSFRELMQRVREASLGAFAHDEVPLEKLVEQLQPDRDLARNPLFQLMFILQNTAKAKIRIPGVEVELLDSYNSTVKFDVLIEFYEIEGGLTGGLGYRSDLFSKSTMKRFADNFVSLVAAMCADPDAPISESTGCFALAPDTQSFSDVLE
jgi:hypothetical protein